MMFVKTSFVSSVTAALTLGVELTRSVVPLLRRLGTIEEQGILKSKCWWPTTACAEGLGLRRCHPSKQNLTGS